MDNFRRVVAVATIVSPVEFRGNGNSPRIKLIVSCSPPPPPYPAPSPPMRAQRNGARNNIAITAAEQCV